MSSILSEGEFLKDKFKIPLSFALLLASQFSIHDKLIQLRKSVEDLAYGVEEEEQIKNNEPWENDDAA